MDEHVQSLRNRLPDGVGAAISRRARLSGRPRRSPSRGHSAEGTRIPDLTQRSGFPPTPFDSSRHSSCRHESCPTRNPGVPASSIGIHRYFPLDTPRAGAFDFGGPRRPGRASPPDRFQRRRALRFHRRNPTLVAQITRGPCASSPRSSGFRGSAESGDVMAAPRFSCSRARDTVELERNFSPTLVSVFRFALGVHQSASGSSKPMAARLALPFDESPQRPRSPVCRPARDGRLPSAADRELPRSGCAHRRVIEGPVTPRNRSFQPIPPSLRNELRVLGLMEPLHAAYRDLARFRGSRKGSLADIHTFSVATDSCSP